MPIDTSIISRGVQPVQLENPLNRMANVLQIQGLQQEQAINALKADEYRSGVDRRNKLLEIAGGQYGKPEEREEALVRGGFFTEAAALGRNRVDAAKVQAETEKNRIDAANKRVDAWGSVMGYVRQNPTPENAQAAVQHLVTLGVMPQEMAQAALAQVQANPQGIAQWADMGFRTALGAKEQLAKITTNNIGGQTITQSADPVTGRTQVVGAVQNTQSPDNAATNARLAADAAAGRAVTMRGQDMTDQRQREANAITAGKPSAAVEKELVNLRQQNSIVDGAIAAVEKTPTAFSMGRGMATMAGPIPESVAGRFDSDAERQARSYVFNNVSKVINERAGAAQSAQELARLRSFLPAETDNADQIKSKLKAFKTYLNDMETGTRGGAKPQTGGASGGWSIQKVQ